MKRNFTTILIALLVFTLNTTSCVTGPKPPPKPKAPPKPKKININSIKTTTKKKKEVQVVAEEPVVYVNQVGYLIDGEKYFISNTPGEKFYVKSTSDNETVYTGDLTLNIENDRSSGMTTYIGYFTDLKTEGSYIIEHEDGTKSYPFKIEKNIYNDVAKKTMLSFYFQRCGTPLLEEHAGVFHRETCHIEDSVYHAENNMEGTKDCVGGWHDAGDYGKYVTPAAVTISPMLMAYELWPQKHNYDDNGIPESGNGVSDFLDEIKYELDWILKMQNTEVNHELYGGVHYMVNTKGYVWTMPEVDESIRYLYGISSVATANFAAILAQAYRTYRNIPTYAKDAEKYLEAALLAWDFLERYPVLYPSVGYKRPEDTLTGGYVSTADQNDKDDRSWAAVELFLSTEDEKFHEIAKSYKSIGSSITKIPEWANVTPLGQLQYMLADEALVDKDIQARLIKGFLKTADGYVKDSSKDGFRDILTSYKWGSNGFIMLQTTYLLKAYELTGDKKYYDTALAQFNYILGLNPVNICYVTKFGSIYPKNIHHAAILNDDIEDIYPGMVPGGANGKLGGDYVMSSFFTRSSPDATCYIDHFDSWASNENCILYNGPLVSVAAFFSEIE